MCGAEKIECNGAQKVTQFRRDRKDALASGSEVTRTGSGSRTPRESLPQKQTKKARDGRTTKGPPQLYLDAVAGLKLPGRERGKGRLCNVSTKSQSQTHLHFRRLPVGFEFFRVASPGASPSTNTQHSDTALHSLCHLSISAMCKRAL